MIKLYKNDGTSYHYWEAWDHNRHITFHQGKLGRTGHTYREPLHFWQKAASLIERAAEPVRARGFHEIPLEHHAELIVQYRTLSWGGPADLEKRHRVEGVLNECLGWTGNGHCDGGDIGSGTINAFSFVVDPHIGAKSIAAALRKAGLIEGVVIAYALDDGFEVLYPKNHRAAFSYSYGA
jgi:hypothetical protein